jgi:hypothetical protein
MDMAPANLSTWFRPTTLFLCPGLVDQSNSNTLVPHSTRGNWLNECLKNEVLGSEVNPSNWPPSNWPPMEGIQI